MLNYTSCKWLEVSFFNLRVFIRFPGYHPCLSAPPPGALRGPRLPVPLCVLLTKGVHDIISANSFLTNTSSHEKLTKSPQTKREKKSPSLLSFL